MSSLSSTHLNVLLILIPDHLPPKLVILPNLFHLLNWNILGLRQKVVNECSHETHEGGEEEEETKLHVTEHGQENLSNDEGEEQVHRDIDALTSRPNLKREDFRGDQPAQWSPGPRKGGDVDANEEDHQIRIGFREGSLACEPEINCNESSNDNLKMQSRV
ncbi:hypothetical protein AMTR_s00029p00047020 [Amborella trichopoda]|uniref:Uncharacterized protein n=1 Tax=Amborella trichopoda TaxID=13333 RepID=W1PMX1_AMBTC|nr:hypothetical protein AMTR_s00029p00047020 [Amborella trichopoda]